MSTASDEKRLDVSIYLLRASQVPVVEGQLFSDATTYQELNQEIPGGRFLPLPTEAAPPKWVEHIQTLLSDEIGLGLLSQNAGGVLWVPRGNKIFVFTFGYAHAKLKDEWLVPDFGKKTALSMIPSGQVVEVRSEQVFARWHIASERAPRASAVRNFGFESDRDLVAAVEGVPSPKYSVHFGGKVRGGTSIKFSIYISKLLETLDVIAERFDSGDYKKTWPQVDNLSIVRDQSLIQILDDELDKLLGAPNPNRKISLAAPAFKSGDKPYPLHYSFGRKGKAPATAAYLLFGNWESYLLKRGKPIGLKSSLETLVHLMDENKDDIETCTMYQCFGTEININGKAYVLSSGVWYEANSQFVKETNGVISALAPAPHSLPAWNQVDDEGAYNAGVPSIDNDISLFDKKLVSFGGGKSRFEFCDLMHLSTKTLYFVKHPSGSASVSHLCEQVRRTVENFFSTDDAFRKKLSQKILKDAPAQDVSWLGVRPQRHEWNLCLVSMGKNASQFPFFAKCGVARLVRELEQGGYRISFQAV